MVVPIGVRADDGRVTGEVFFAEFQAKGLCLFHGQAVVGCISWVIAFLAPCGAGRVNDKKVNFEECKYKFYWNKSLFKEMGSFAGWNFAGSFAYSYVNEGY